MRIYFGNLPTGITAETLLDFVSDFIYREIDRNTVIVDNSSGFAECFRLAENNVERTTNLRQLIDSDIKRLDGKTLFGNSIVVRWEKPNEFGQFLVSKIERQKELPYKLSDDKVRRIWEDLVELGYVSDDDYMDEDEEDLISKRFNRLTMPSFLQELETISQKFKLHPILIEEDFIATIFSVPYARQVKHIHVYEALYSPEVTIFIHAFVKDKRFSMKCWSSVAVSNQSGRIVFMPAGYSWRENWDRFVLDIRGMIATATKKH